MFMALLPWPNSTGRTTYRGLPVVLCFLCRGYHDYLEKEVSGVVTEGKS